ncbi:hypothetical protein JQ617_02740 [Bradyrhizobium sp. KB893862 SZCCT0404]|uniref:hypothetical protein n=1 Tax=Bradyrhizobium sp. KB893862 SZCCT0404 TaxID=2807672 RepID=UPI001BAAE490|nr:hypothetical protein [Bradyrhizobium sp. KB893862 SZCCT0404]MBR1172860.1 hypothetical protein [Bradyrhizobium sp. KB893862 SZCCT0404]
MRIFKSTPEKTVQRDIEAAAANRERVSARLTECDQAIARHASAAKDCALSGDDAGLDAAQTSLRSAQDRAVTLRSALSEIDQQIAHLERTKAEMADRKLRSETAAEIELLARKLGEIGAEFNGVAQRMSEQTRRAVPIVYEALGIDNFTKVCLAEVPQALELVSTMLRAHADAVLAGTASAKLPLPEGALAEVPAPAPSEDHYRYLPIKPKFGPT